jgi:hypothetical protein
MPGAIADHLTSAGGEPRCQALPQHEALAGQKMGLLRTGRLAPAEAATRFVVAPGYALRANDSSNAINHFRDHQLVQLDAYDTLPQNSACAMLGSTESAPIRRYPADAKKIQD